MRSLLVKTNESKSDIFPDIGLNNAKICRVTYSSEVLADYFLIEFDDDISDPHADLLTFYTAVVNHTPYHRVIWNDQIWKILEPEVESFISILGGKSEYK